MKKQSAAIILAAGLSERMGKPKFALKFDAKKTFLAEIVGRFVEFGCEEIIIVMNKNGKELMDRSQIQLPEIVKIVISPHPESGRFSSIKIGLNYLQNRNRVFVHNVDNPFVDTSLLGLLFNNLREADYCVPVYKNRGGHPILLMEEAIVGILNCDENDLNLRKYLERFNKMIVEVDDPNILININTPWQYEKIFQNILILNTGSTLISNMFSPNNIQLLILEILQN